MTAFNRATKKLDKIEDDFEGWFRANTNLMKELRYAESIKEIRAALNAFKFQMKRSRNRFFIATRLHEYVKAAKLW